MSGCDLLSCKREMERCARYGRVRCDSEGECGALAGTCSVLFVLRKLMGEERGRPEKRWIDWVEEDVR